MRVKVLIDASQIIHANWHTQRNGRAGKSFAECVADNLERILEDLVIEGLDTDPLLLFDSQPYFRSEIYPEYKFNRAAEGIPVDTVKELLRTKYKCVEWQKLEADDLAYILTKHGPNDTPYILLSSDRDWGQTVDVNKKINNIMQYCNFKKDFIDYTAEPTWRCKIILGDLKDNVPRALPKKTGTIKGNGEVIEKDLRVGEVSVDKLYKTGMHSNDILQKYGVSYTDPAAQLTYQLIVFNETLYNAYIPGYQDLVTLAKNWSW
jgi:5'-3' exonuclease